MSDIRVSVHELKARLSEMEYAESGKKGLASVDWSEFAGLADHVDEIYQSRQDETYREIPV